MMTVVVGGVMDGRRFSTGMIGLRIRTPLVTHSHGTNRFIVIGINRGNRHVPLAVTKTSAAGKAVALIVRTMKNSSGGVYRLGTNSCVASLINPLKRTARVRGINAIIYTNNNINITPLLPVIRTFRGTNGHIVMILTTHAGRLIVLRRRVHTGSSRIVIVASSNSCNAGNLIAGNIRDIVGHRGISLYIAVNPTIVVGFISTLAGGCRVPAITSLGAVVISKAKVYNTYHVAIKKGAGFIYISKPRFSTRRMSFSRVLVHLNTCGSVRGGWQGRDGRVAARRLVTTHHTRP